jgi:signal transduction histidine kinase
MNKRLLAIYSAVFILIMVMLYLYRQSYNSLKIFSGDVGSQTEVVIRLHRLDDLLKFWVSNDRNVQDNLDRFMPADVAYDSILFTAGYINQIVVHQEQRLRMDSIKTFVRAYQRLVENSEDHRRQNEIRKQLAGLMERSLLYARSRQQHRSVRLEESTALLDKWVFWMLSSAAILIIVATFYSFNFLRLRRRAEGFSKILLENTNNGIISFEPIRDVAGIADYKITYCNEAATKLLKISGWRNKTLSTILTPGILSDVREAFDSVIYTNESKTIEGYLEHELERTWIQSTISPLEEGILVSMYNLNPVKSFEQRLKYQIKQLELANDELQQYAYITSHDLQEPLRKIQMFSDIGINEDPEYSKRNKDDLFRKISATASHMRVLIQTLLLFTRSTDQPNEFSLVDLNIILKEVIHELEVSIEEKNGSVKLDELPCIQGSAIHLKLLFNNLISNSLKYAKPNVRPLIHVKTRPVSREDYERFTLLDELKTYTCIYLQDNGLGFKPELNEKIFTIFQRLHSREEIPGTGIGLAICRKIVHQHHGHIFAEGEENQGATFYVFLPLEQPGNEELT